ncbi:recombinase RecT [Saccharothrix xinjiangensis]|uniref:Recombinase RecT n=1 Tax=Saccharothrix xinjiangensis TaxID=204798 RepID=A0ABV9XTH6_9PSEU
MGTGLKARVGKYADNIRVLDPAAFDAPLAAPADKPSEPLPEKTLIEHLRGNRDMFAEVAPDGFELEAMLKEAEAALLGSDKLRKCDHLSLLGAVMSAAQLGLRIGDEFGHAWLEPIWQPHYAHTTDGKWTGHFRARLIVGYRGMIALAESHPKISTVIGVQVGAREEFKLKRGLKKDKLKHTLHTGPGTRGDAVAYYALARYTDGSTKFWHFTRAEAEEHRDKFASQRRFNEKTGEWRVVGPWKKHFDAMAIKTCIRMLAKQLPTSSALAAAIAVDGGVRVDLGKDGIHHADRPETLNSNAPSPDHEGGHGDGLAWSPECEYCVDDVDGEKHFEQHATAAPVDGCAYCEQEAAWRGLPTGSPA